MNHRLPRVLIRRGALPLVFVLMAACAGIQGGEEAGTAAEPGAEKKRPVPAQNDRFHSGLLPSLQVAGEDCYVYVEAREQSPFFGPLIKKERVTWIGAQGDWVQIWIPRIRETGWVPGAQVQEINPAHEPSIIPEHLLSTVTVSVANANIRTRPTTRSQVIDVKKKGQSFWMTNERRGWYQIWLPEKGQKGWIHSNIASKQCSK